MMKILKNSSIGKAAAIMFLAAMLLIPSAHAAPDFFLYGNQGASNVTEANVQPVIDSWFTAVDFFRAGPNQGKMLAATGTSIYIQDTVGGSTWTKVGEVYNVMDPCFIKISPSGTKVALGLGWMQDILVFDATVLDAGTPEDPVLLEESEDVLIFPVSHYDAAWAGEDHIVINAGDWVVEGVSSISGVGVLNITDEMNEPTVIVAYVPGASSGVAVDADFNLVFGNGYDYDASDISGTGELRVWPASAWWGGTAPLGTLLDYLGTENFRIAEAVLSSAHLGFDAEGNLHVGGGRFVSPDPENFESGYAVLINQSVVATAVSTKADNLVDESNGSQYREFAPDACGNDTATTVLANGRELSVVWNPATAPGDANCVVGSNSDYWIPGVQPVITTYTIDTTNDMDGDTIYDVADNSPNTAHSDNTDTDGDGYGNIIDADFNNDGVVNMTDFAEFAGAYGSAGGEVDMNGDGVVNMIDFSYFQQKYGKSAPYYNF